MSGPATGGVGVLFAGVRRAWQVSGCPHGWVLVKVGELVRRDLRLGLGLSYPDPMVCVTTSLYSSIVTNIDTSILLAQTSVTTNDHPRSRPASWCSHKSIYLDRTTVLISRYIIR